jgi:hypothetical protein
LVAWSDVIVIDDTFREWCRLSALHGIRKYVHCRTGACVDGESAIWIYTVIALGNTEHYHWISIAIVKYLPVVPSWLDGGP